MAKYYTYLTSMIDDVLEYFRSELKYEDDVTDADFSNRDTLSNALYEFLWRKINRPPYSNTCIENAKACLYGNWPLLLEAAKAFNMDLSYICKCGPFHADVLIRCYLLRDAIRYAIDILEANDEITYTATSA